MAQLLTETIGLPRLKQTKLGKNNIELLRDATRPETDRLGGLVGKNGEFRLEKLANLASNGSELAVEKDGGAVDLVLGGESAEEGDFPFHWLFFLHPATLQVVGLAILLVTTFDS